MQFHGFIFGLLLFGYALTTLFGSSPACWVAESMQPMADVWRAVGLLATIAFLGALFLGDQKARFGAFVALMAVFVIPEIGVAVLKAC